MAEEALNLSLDDIIKRNAENNRKKSPSTRGGKRGGRGGRGGRGSSFQPRVQTRVLKPVRGGRQGRGAPRTERQHLPDAPRDLDALHGDKPWQKDQFPALMAAAPRRGAQQRGGDLADGTKLEVSNLDQNVTDNDIKELFQVCGDLKRWGVRFDDETGNSRGTAFVQFIDPENAQKAYKQYNNVALDGKPMRIQFDEGTNRTLSSGIRIGDSTNRSGRLVQMPRTFNMAAASAQLGGGSNMRSSRPSGMRSAMRMDED